MLTSSQDHLYTKPQQHTIYPSNKLTHVHPPPEPKIKVKRKEVKMLKIKGS